MYRHLRVIVFLFPSREKSPDRLNGIPIPLEPGRECQPSERRHSERENKDGEGCSNVPRVIHAFAVVVIAQSCEHGGGESP